MKNARMPNKSKKSGNYSDTDSGAMGSNHGNTGGLSKSDEMRADVVKTPDTTNRFPKGLA